jgi:hypothetical protein
MGVPKFVATNLSFGGLNAQVQPSSDWVIAHNDCKTATSNFATVALEPSTYSDANAFPIRVPPTATRLLLRARYSKNITACTQSPLLAVFGAYGPDTSFNESTGAFDNDGTIRWVRLDVTGGISGSNTGGVNLPMQPSLTGGVYRDMADNVYKYGSFTGELGGTSTYYIGLELFACKWVLLLVGTAASGITASGATTVQCEAAFFSGQFQPYGIAV